jgi:methylmalonyl-CoA mutase, N-terminal domain
MAEDVKRTDSGIEIAPLYSEADLAGWSAEEKLGVPGGAPYTRGVYPTMYRGKLWTMRQYAGFGSAETTNQRFKFLLDAGQTGLVMRIRPSDADGLRLGSPSQRR